MRIERRATTAAVSFFLAAATGHVMQNGKAISAHLFGVEPSAVSGLTEASLTSASTEGVPSRTAVEPAADGQLAAAVAAAIPDFPDLPRIDPLPLLTKVRLVSRTDDALALAAPSMADREYDAFGQLCAAPKFTLMNVAPAMLAATLTAACHPNETLKVSHAGLTFSVRSDDKGHFSAMIPALAAKGEVTISFEHGPELRAAQVVPDLGSVSRFAVNTRGQAGLHLNAYIAGEGLGEAVHIRPDAPGLQTLEFGGFLTMLGDRNAERPLLAEVFTAPANRPQARVEVVADVTPDNCARDILGTTLSLNGSVLPTAGAVSFAMPDCDGVGGVLVMDAGQPAVTAAMASAEN